MALTVIAKDVTTVSTTGSVVIGGSGSRVYQASITGTSGLQTATVVVEGTNEEPTDANSEWLLINSHSLSGTTTDSDPHASVIPWNAVRVDVTAISGTGASVDVAVSYTSSA